MSREPPLYVVDQVGRAYVVRDTRTARVVGRHVRLADAIRIATRHAAATRQEEPDR